MRHIIFLLITLSSLVACHKPKAQEETSVISVSTRKMTNVFYYTGTIRPLKTVVLAAPVEGTVIDMPVQYGEPVKQGQLVFVLSSSKFTSEYKNGLLGYIKSKNEFNTAKSQLAEAKFLHKHELISDDDFKMKQSSYYAARLSLIQSEDNLKGLLNQLNIKDLHLEKLNIANIDRISKALDLENESKELRIKAPINGVLLAASKGDEDNKKILKGDLLKQDEALAVIGEMSGLSIRIKVNELTVNQLQLHQKVKITGIAFSDVLTGEIERIDKQGEAANGGIPTFSVDILVKQLTQPQQRYIHVGMSAKVAIEIDEGKKMTIPINSIIEKNGQAFVRVLDQKTKKIDLRQIETGKTGEQSVTVLAGLKEGENIVISNQTS